MFLGVDLGAGSLKATIITSSGRVVGEASAEIATARPRVGWAEQDPADWEAAMAAALRQLATTVDLKKIEGVSFTGGTHTSVLTDRNGEIVRRPILWSDQRAGGEAAELNARFEQRLIKIAYNRAAATWSISPLYWLKKNDRESVERTAHVQFAKDWLRSRLTGDLVTDRIDAQGTLMLRGDNFQWSDELVDLIGWNKATLPEVREPTDRAGSVSAGAASKFGLKQGTPVFVGTCDTAAETWGAGAISTGDAVIKLATAGVVSVMVDRPFLQPEIAYKSYVVPGSGYVLGAINSCASAHKWLRNLLVGADSGSKGFAMLDQEAASAPAGADGVLFHPYLQGERAPYWDPKLRADFLGMTMSHGRGHLTRAFYEGVAFALRDASSPFMAAGLKIGQASLIGGGAKSDLWAKIIADVFQIPISKPLHGDASFAAALLAGVGAGAFADTRDAVTQTMKLSLTIEPDNNNRDLYDQAFAGYKKSKILLTDLNHEISSRVNK